MEATFGSNQQDKLVGDESFVEDIVELKARISKLSTENDNYRQQLYDLQRKLETNMTMQSELVESNDALERSLKEHQSAINRRINQIEEKHTARRKELEEKIEEMEAKLGDKSKENRELCEIIKKKNETLQDLLKNRDNNGTIKDVDNSEFLKSELQEISQQLANETETRKQLENLLESSQTRCNEMREILASAKQQQAEKDILVEGMRDQLMSYKMEIESSKSSGTYTETSKGNSLFAEVEDRRKMTLEQMSAMRNGYLEAKRSFQAKEAEIRALKAERAIFFRKWEDDSIEKVQQDARLIDKYKARITELENQLKDEKKKTAIIAKSHKLPGASHFTYLQSLVDEKKKEVEELRTKIENNSINALLEEEAKHKMGKQVRYWRFRAITGEAQLVSIKNRLESDPSSSNDEILETIKSLSTSVQDIEMDETAGGESTLNRDGTIINETITTLDNLMTIPKKMIPTRSWTDKPEGDSEDPPKVLCSIKMEKKSREEKENSPIVTPILKSVLAKPNPDLGAILSCKETNERDKKTLRFTDDTVDPPSKTLKKQTVAKPKYPIIFISSTKPNN